MAVPRDLDLPVEAGDDGARRRLCQVMRRGIGILVIRTMRCRSVQIGAAQKVSGGVPVADIAAVDATRLVLDEHESRGVAVLSGRGLDGSGTVVADVLGAGIFAWGNFLLQQPTNAATSAGHRDTMSVPFELADGGKVTVSASLVSSQWL